MNDRAGTTDTEFWGEVDADVALDRYQTLVNAVDDGIYQLDADGHFVAVNEEIVERTGYARDDLLGSHVSLVLGESDVSEIEREIRGLLETDESHAASIDIVVRTAEGERVPYEVRLNLLRDGDEFLGTVGIVRDITDRRRREQALRQERRLLDHVLKASPVGITALTPDGEIVTLNDRATEIVGVDRDDLTDVTYVDSEWDIYDADGEPTPPEERTFARVVETGESVTDSVSQVELADGSRVWLSVNGAPVFDQDGDLSLIVLTYEDITELKERERQLQQERTQTEELLKTAPVAISVADADGGTMLANERAQDLLGLSEREIIEEPENVDEWSIYDADGEPLDPAETPSARAAATGEPVLDEEMVIERPSGERMWVSVNAAPVFGPDGTLDRVVTAGEDITQLKRRTRQLERRKTELQTELGEILGRISDAFYALDDEFRFTHVNDRAEAILQRTEEELLGRSVWEAFPEAAESPFWEEFHAAMDTQEPVSFELGVAEIDAWLEFNVYPSETGLSVYFRDVTDRVERERALEESERRYRTLVENFPNGAVGLFDEELCYTAAGGQLLEETGVAEEDRIGRSIFEIYPDDLVAEVEPYFHAALDGEANSFEAQYAGRHLLAHTLPVRNADGDIFAGMLVVQDITDRKRAEQELRESEAKFRMLAENLEETVWMSTPDADEVLYVNPAYEDVWGRDRESLYEDPLSFLERVHPDDRERVREAYTALPDAVYEEEFRVVQPNGEVRWVHARADAVRDGDDVFRIVGIADDVTERKERERALEESERRYRTLAEHFPNGAVGVYDRDLRYTLAEGGVLGDRLPDASSLEGNRMTDLFPEDVVADLEPLFRAAVEDGKTESDTTTFGGREWRVWTTPLRDADGDVFAGLSFTQDITEQVEREERLEELIDKLEESNERLEQFAYAASHDLQEPLRMVSSYLQLVERRYADDLDADATEFIEFAVDGADRMRGMIDGLLAYSRVETQGEEFEPVDLDAVLTDVSEDLQVRIRESDAEITREPLPTVEGDRGQLRQVFQNLVSNAIEYSGDGPPRVHVDAERDGTEWTVSVRDDGVGIDPTDADRIFEVFQSLHAPDDRSGTGIGLALCERIVERHGGDIWVDSEPGEGSTFSFTLPAVRGGGA